MRQEGGGPGEAERAGGGREVASEVRSREGDGETEAGREGDGETEAGWAGGTEPGRGCRGGRGESREKGRARGGEGHGEARDGETEGDGGHTGWGEWVGKDGRRPPGCGETGKRDRKMEKR